MVAHEKADITPKTWGRLREEQVRLYAGELAKLFHHEQELRRELLVKNGELEKRIQELTALNAMFQKHLDMRIRTQEAFKQLAEGVCGLMDQANQLVRHTQSLAADGSNGDSRDSS